MVGMCACVCLEDVTYVGALFCSFPSLLCDGDGGYDSVFV